jgi:hypothetical protein
LKRGLALCLMAINLALVAPMPVRAQLTPSEKFAVKPDFNFPKSAATRIVLFRPDISVFEQATGGIDQPDAAGTAKARNAVVEALIAALEGRGMTAVPMPDLKGDDARLLADYQSMIKLVVDTAMKHQLFPDDTLPSRTKAFDWSVGPGIARLGAVAGGDYGLFVYSADSYASRGRNALRTIGVVTNMLGDASRHVGYAGLVDLHTGNLVWLYANVAMTSDIRNDSGAKLRISKILTGLPVRKGQ